jgi:hypothetical protein
MVQAVVGSEQESSIGGGGASLSQEIVVKATPTQLYASLTLPDRRGYRQYKNVSMVPPWSGAAKWARNERGRDRIKEWIGHTSLKITSRYTHFDDDYRREVTNLK